MATLEQSRLPRRTAWLAAAALSVCALTLGAAGTANAQAYINVQLGPPPPPAQVYVPPPRAGYTWAPAHYEYRHGQYVWTRGYWVRERPGYVYVAPVWQRRGNGWAYQAARWDRSAVPGYANGPRYRDRDRDGVPNRYDRHPHNPYRR